MAGRIPQPFIDDLIDRSDIVEVISSRLTLKKTGKNYSACCPFHNEKTPSFSVSPQKQFYYCFGCGAGGNVIGFLMENDHLDFPSAVETLAKVAGMEIPREQSNPQAEARQRRRLDIYTELEKAADYYRSVLKQTPKAIDYLKYRGLSGEVAKQFALGYVPDEWDSLIKLCGNDSPSVQRMIDGGMLIARDQKERGNEQNRDQFAPSTNTRDYYDRFRDRVMFPIRDQRGRTIAFGGRVLGDQKPKYLNSPETPVFHKSRELYGLYEVLQQRQRPDELIVVEGYMDVVALAQFDVRNAVATLGTSAGTAHMERIFRHVSKVVFCFDGDKAGRSAAKRALDACLPSMLDGRQARFLFLPEGEDPDTIVRTEGSEGFHKRVERAKTLSDFIFDLAAIDLDLSKDDERALLAHNALPYISQLPKGFLQSVMLKRLADGTGIDKEELTQSLKDTKSAKIINGSAAENTIEAQPSERTNNSDSADIKPKPASEYGEYDYAPVDDDDGASKAEYEDSLQLTEPEKHYSKSFKNLLNLIFKHPKLALDSKLDHDIVKREDHLALISDIQKLVTQNPYTTFGHMHGYWTGSRIEVINKINDIIDPKIIEDLEDEKVEDDFQETLTRFIQRQTRKDIEQRIREISAVPFEELTAEQRKEQRALHNQLKTL